MTQRYDPEWPLQEAHKVQPVQKVRVVVTRTTGELGSYLLAQLLASGRVENVWAMNRESDKGNTQGGGVASFEVYVDKGLEVSNMGLSDGLYNEATIIIHNAWPVNFNLSQQSFEASIRGGRNLLDLTFHSAALTVFPKFLFTSSISVAGTTGPGNHLKEVPVVLDDCSN
ncbi:putative L-aminoadipate-semialdehyde dehydrogenase [Rhizoctonia solani 123E]|uniref:Putative L-aminoadipate-semialdehyde dehydrogenase n=1 Tax=Rhizoctonia solani 123E TaxID=1423351 RepID=A0A074RTP4_9AGAM|nr:putative L-aminoadipate-semialdehyde dehydrogenase [Rhizoctonia solani 123E]